MYYYCDFILSLFYLFNFITIFVGDRPLIGRILKNKHQLFDSSLQEFVVVSTMDLYFLFCIQNSLISNAAMTLIGYSG